MGTVIGLHNPQATRLANLCSRGVRGGDAHDSRMRSLFGGGRGWGDLCLGVAGGEAGARGGGGAQVRDMYAVLRNIC